VLQLLAFSHIILRIEKELERQEELQVQKKAVNKLITDGGCGQGEPDGGIFAGIRG